MNYQGNQKIEQIKFRGIVFKRANQLFKTGLSWSESLKEAWRRYRAYKREKIQNLVARMNGFDFYYHYSDDHSKFSYWSKEQGRIKGELRQFGHSFMQEVCSLVNKEVDTGYFIR